jgi:hypothetical protein
MTREKPAGLFRPAGFDPALKRRGVLPSPGVALGEIRSHSTFQSTFQLGNDCSQIKIPRSQSHDKRAKECPDRGQRKTRQPSSDWRASIPSSRRRGVLQGPGVARTRPDRTAPTVDHGRRYTTASRPLQGRRKEKPHRPTSVGFLSLALHTLFSPPPDGSSLAQPSSGLTGLPGKVPRCPICRCSPPPAGQHMSNVRFASIDRSP